MPTVTLQKIDRNIVLRTQDYDWLKDRLGTPLPLSGLDYDRYGKLAYITVYRDDSVLLLFVGCGKNEYTLRNLRGTK